MSNAVKRISALCTALFLLFQALPALAGEGEGPGAGYSVGTSNVVYTAQALADWCNENRDGGTVYLGCDVTLTSHLAAYLTDGHITIDAGSHSLILDAAAIGLKEYTVVGTGVDKPVVDVHNAYAFRGHWSMALFNLNVTATGDGTAGGTAVRVRDVVDEGWKLNVSILGGEGDIRAYGEHARGVVIDVPADFYCFRVQVQGSGSIAVEAPDGAELYYCKLRADGADASVISDNDILLNTCALSPVPAQGRIEQPSLQGQPPLLYHPVKQFCDPGSISPGDAYTDLCSGGDPVNGHRFPVYWAVEQLDHLDTAVLGKTTVDGYIDKPFNGLGLEAVIPHNLQIDVRDPALPCISRVWKNDGEIRVALWDLKVDEASPPNLLRSDDDGLTWYSITDASYITWLADDFFSFPAELIETPFQIVVEVTDVGESNTVRFLPNSTYPWDLGGDRTGTDHGGGKDPADPGDDDNPTDPGDDDDPTDPGDDDPPAIDDPEGPVPTPPGGAGPSIGTGWESGSGGGSERPVVYPPTAPAPSPPALMEAQTPDPQRRQAAAAEINPFADPLPQENYIETPDQSPARSVTLSGERIAAMIAANPVRVTFTVDGVRVVVPTDALAALGIREGQLFTIQLVETAEGLIARFLLDGEEVVLPGELLPAVSTDEDKARRTEDPAVHAMPSVTPAADIPSPGFPVLPVAAGAVSLGGASAWLFRRRLWKR